MELNRESLISIGLSESQADQVVQAHSDAINGKFIPKSRFDEVNDQLKDVKGQVSERDTQIASLKKFQGTADELKTKVTDLQQSNAKASEEYAAKLASVQKNYAIRSEIGTDAQDPDLILKLIDTESVSINSDGKALGVREQLDALHEDRPYLFKTTEDSSSSSDSSDSGNQSGVRGFRPPESAASGVGSKQFNAEKFGAQLAQSRNSGIETANASTDYYFSNTNTAKSSTSAQQGK